MKRGDEASDGVRACDRKEGGKELILAVMWVDMSEGFVCQKSRISLALGRTLYTVNPV